MMISTLSQHLANCMSWITWSAAPPTHYNITSSCVLSWRYTDTLRSSSSSLDSTWNSRINSALILCIWELKEVLLIRRIIIDYHWLMYFNKLAFAQSYTEMEKLPEIYQFLRPYYVPHTQIYVTKFHSWEKSYLLHVFCYRVIVQEDRTLGCIEVFRVFKKWCLKEFFVHRQMRHLGRRRVSWYVQLHYM